MNIGRALYLTSPRKVWLQRAGDNPADWMTTNVVSLARLAERLRHLDFLDRYVHVTTPEVYGSTSGWIAEEAPINPSTPYAVSRAGRRHVNENLPRNV
jgi:dTDP-D-glucose 4,6-dehydratase